MNDYSTNLENSDSIRDLFRPKKTNVLISFGKFIAECYRIRETFSFGKFIAECYRIRETSSTEIWNVGGLYACYWCVFWELESVSTFAIYMFHVVVKDYYYYKNQEYSTGNVWPQWQVGIISHNQISTWIHVVGFMWNLNYPWPIIHPLANHIAPYEIFSQSCCGAIFVPFNSPLSCNILQQILQPRGLVYSQLTGLLAFHRLYMYHVQVVLYTLRWRANINLLFIYLE